MDSLESMKILFDRKAMGELVHDIARAARKKALPVGTARSWSSPWRAPELSFPCLIKSRAACGVDESHHMALVLRREGLDECELEGQLLAQEYLNHGGLVFKVYVGSGGRYQVARKESIPDIETITDDMPSCIEFDSLRSLPTRLPWTGTTPSSGDARENSTHAHKPSFGILTEDFFSRLVHVVREYVHLSIFGFDVLLHHNAGEAVIIDVNYFPRLFDGWRDAL